MNLLKKIWSRTGSLNLTIVLCGLLTLDLTWAYFTLEKDLPVFSPLSDVGLPRWLLTYARHNLKATFWFLALMVLLTLLAINTFACTTDRVARLLRRRPRGWLGALGPHVMHYAVLVILLGYLGSYALSSSQPGSALKPGASLNLPGGGRLTLLGAAPNVYQGRRLDFFQGYVLDPGIRLELASGAETREAGLSFNRPVRFQGLNIHLIDFYPRKGSGDLRYIKLIIRRDPAAAVYLGGLGLFFIGLIIYCLDLFYKRGARDNNYGQV